MYADLPQALWRDLIRSKDVTLRGKQQTPGEGFAYPDEPSVVWIKNNTGGKLDMGAVVEVTTALLADVQPNQAWFNSAASPDATRPFAICLDNLPDDEIGPAQIAGRVPALVNVSSMGHRYAKIESGQTALQSADNGPVRLLVAPTATGEALRWVLIGSDTPPPRLAVLREPINPPAGGIRGSAQARELSYAVPSNPAWVGERFLVIDLFLNAGDNPLPKDTKFIVKSIGGQTAVLTEPYCAPADDLPVDETEP